MGRYLFLLSHTLLWPEMSSIITNVCIGVCEQSRNSGHCLRDGQWSLECKAELCCEIILGAGRKDKCREKYYTQKPMHEQVEKRSGETAVVLDLLQYCCIVCCRDALLRKISSESQTFIIFPPK